MKSYIKNPIKQIIAHFFKIFCKRKKKKDIVFIVLNELMFSYAFPIYENLKDDQRLRLKFCFYKPERFSKDHLKQIICDYNLRTISRRMAELFCFDLAIYPSHGPRMQKSCASIYMSHGLRSGKLIKGESYRFGQESLNPDGTISYDKIFVASELEKEDARQNYPEHYLKVKVVGNLLVDKMLAKQSQREETLSQLNLDPNRKTVMFTSTWGPHSFAQNIGIDLINYLPEILKSYNVILSMHQHNFLPQCSPEINWPEIIRMTQYENLYILNEKDSSTDILVGSDLLVMDHTSLGLYYLFLNRPVIFYNHPDAKYQSLSFILKLREVAYPWNGIDRLQEDIELAFEQFRQNQYQSFVSHVCSHLHKAWDRFEEEIYDSLGIEKYSSNPPA